MYYVVVDTDETVNALLERGNLQQRKTFIPLNKMTDKETVSNILAAAERVGGRGNVWAPMELVQYDQQVERAIVHLFGNVLICRDLDSAKKVVSEVNVLCVTLQGESISPDGDMSCGAAMAVGSVLGELKRLAVKRKELEMA